MNNTDCIFCKIVAGTIPSTKVYEDEASVAFLDISPIHPGHTLVIPKDHHENILEIAEGTLKHLTGSVQKVARGVKDATMADGISVITLTGEAAGQTVFHIHFHIIPRYHNDGLKGWAHGTYKTVSEKIEMSEKIKQALE